MPNMSKNIQEDKKRNKPNIIAPIINTTISTVAIVGTIILKVTTTEFSWGLFICFLVVLLMFPVASWYTSYFSKKQKTKMLGSFEKETELIVEFMQNRKHFKAFEESDKVKVTATFEEVTDVNKFEYNKEKSSLGFPNHENALVSIGIGFAGLEIDPENFEVIGVKGLLPRSIWLKKNFPTPTPKKAKITINTTGVEIRNKTYIQINKQSDTYYNPKTGWICIGEYKVYGIDDVLEFVENGYLVVRDNKIISFWLYVGKDLPLM